MSMYSGRPWSAHAGGTAAFSSSEYEAAKRRVKRLESPAATLASHRGTHGSSPAQGGVEGGGGKGGVGGGMSFLDRLQKNISELRQGIVRKLEQSPQLKAMVDADIKEMQLHIDRIILHQLSEMDMVSTTSSELKKGFQKEVEELHEQHLKDKNNCMEELISAAEEANRRADAAEARASMISEDCMAEQRRREAEMEQFWQERVAALTEQLSNDLVASKQKMEIELHEAHERDKRAAMRELTEALIPKIEAEFTETHQEEVDRYRKRVEEEKRRGEAREKELEAQLAKAKDELRETIDAMAQLSTTQAVEQDAKTKLQEVVSECLRLNNASAAKDATIADLRACVRALEHNGVEIVRLQGVIAELMVEREESEERARYNEEMARREIDEQQRVVSDLQKRHVSELSEIRTRVKRAIEAKESERAELARRLALAEGRLAETEAVLQRAKLDIGAL